MVYTLLLQKTVTFHINFDKAPILVIQPEENLMVEIEIISEAIFQPCHLSPDVASQVALEGEIKDTFIKVKESKNNL